MTIFHAPTGIARPIAPGREKSCAQKAGRIPTNRPTPAGKEEKQRERPVCKHPSSCRVIAFYGSSKESVGKTRMSFSLFNQDTDLKKSPSPFPLPLEREFFSPLLSGHTPPLPERSAFFSLSWGRGKGEGPFPRHRGGTCTTKRNRSQRSLRKSNRSSRCFSKRSRQR